MYLISLGIYLEGKTFAFSRRKFFPLREAPILEGLYSPGRLESNQDVIKDVIARKIERKKNMHLNINIVVPRFRYCTYFYCLMEKYCYLVTTKQHGTVEAYLKIPKYFNVEEKS